MSKQTVARNRDPADEKAVSRAERELIGYMALPKSRVVKAFKHGILGVHGETGRLGDQPLIAFVAGDDAGARSAQRASLLFDAWLQETVTAEPGSYTHRNLLCFYDGRAP